MEFREVRKCFANENYQSGPAGSKCTLLVLVVQGRGGKSKACGCTCRKELVKSLAGPSRGRPDW